MARYIAHGLESEFNLASTHMGNGKQRTSSALLVLMRPPFAYEFAEVFNGDTFWKFLIHLVARFAPRKVFLIIDNAPYHWLPEDGKAWLRRNRTKIELHRLPAYSPEFNPMEPIWKVTRKRTTHNRFYATTQERDEALRKTFNNFQRRPKLIDPHVAVFR